MNYLTQKALASLVWILALVVVTMTIVSIVTHVQNYKIKKELVNDTTSAVSQCLSDTYHSREVDSRQTGEYSYEKYSVKDVPVEKCEKIRDVMLSIYK